MNTMQLCLLHVKDSESCTIAEVTEWKFSIVDNFVIELDISHPRYKLCMPRLNSVIEIDWTSVHEEFN